MKFRLTNLLLGVVLYLVALGFLLSLDFSLVVFFVIYAGFCYFLTNRMIHGAEFRKSKNNIEFSKSGALDSIGEQFESFHHVFFSNEAVIDAYQDALGKALSEKLGCPAFKEVILKDVDRDLHQPEGRVFLQSGARITSRNCHIFLLCIFSKSLNIQGVRWWVIVSGDRDPNKVFWRYALSPLYVFSLLIPYIRRKYDPLSGLNTVHPGLFNSIDVLNRSRELEFVAFETLVNVLESFGIDTSDLKQQKANILNINVSGGKTSFGSVVQGAMNKVSSKIGGAK